MIVLYTLLANYPPEKYLKFLSVALTCDLAQMTIAFGRSAMYQTRGNKFKVLHKS